MGGRCLTEHLASDLLDEEALSPEDRALLEEYLATQEGLIAAASTGIISSYTPQAHQLPFHQSLATNRWFVGANRTGKTLACYEEIRYFVEGEHPYRNLPGPAKLIWVCCPTAELSTLYHQPGVIEAVGRENVAEYKRGAIPMLIMKNGCLIIFKFYSQGPKAFPSAGCDLIFCDEEPPWPVFEEMWSRRSTRVLNIIGANTMVQGFTWMYDKVIKRMLPGTEWFTAKLDDNLFIPQSERDAMKAGLVEDETAYAIRVEGKIVPVGGKMRFNPSVLAEMFQKGVKEPRARFDFDFENERWVQNPTGRLSMYEMPEEGYEYVMGVDAAEGLNVNYEGGEPLFDETSCQVFNRVHRRFDADYTAGDIEPIDIGRYILPRLHKLFNNAKANIELNNHGHTIAYEARDQMMGYLWAPKADRAAKAPRINRRLGTQLSQTSRRYMIDVSADCISNRDIQIPSGPTLQQFMGFVKKSNNRVEHQDGMKDDRVFACGHALVCDRDLPPPRVAKPRTIRDVLHEEVAREQRQKKRLLWYRKIA